MRKDKPRNLANNFYLALQGRWYSAQERFEINIDPVKGYWIFLTAKGKRIRQKWRLRHKRAKRLHLEHGQRHIVATVNKDGRLILTGRKGPILFHSIKDGTKHRLCPSCYGKTEWRKKTCVHCSWRFG